MWPIDQLYIELGVKVAFFQNDQLGIGVGCGKLWEMGQKWILEPLFSEI